MSYKVKKQVSRALAGLLALFMCLYFLQTYWVHRKGNFCPDYPLVALTENSDYQTMFLQTGLGKMAVDKLLAEDEFELVLAIQDKFFEEANVKCTPIFGWFTKSDRIEKNMAPLFADLQPGDIILTLSTHSCGWRHGHAGLVVDQEHVLECTTLGEESAIVSIHQWSGYSEFVVLRVKGITEELQQEVVTFAKENLCGVPYHLYAGFVGKKAPKVDDSQFGLQCAYLVWYAWQHFGYDLDSDRGRLVSSSDLLRSELVEVVQIYGMDPREFFSLQ
jgi:uncharacterized protein YycO